MYVLELHEIVFLINQVSNDPYSHLHLIAITLEPLAAGYAIGTI